MGRTLTSDLQNILAASARTVEYTIEILFPKNATKYLATAPLTIASQAYTNDLESVSEIRQTLENPADRVRLALQNKDGVLGLNLGGNEEEWRGATAIIGRYYEDKVGLGLSAWIELFRGTIQIPETDDFQMSFEVATDTLAKGAIVASGTLAYPCRFIYKDPSTCGATSAETACNHVLKSKGGCQGRDNSHHFGGMESLYNPDQNVPGTGGNTIVPFPPQDRCPRLDQYILIKDYWGNPIGVPVGKLQIKDKIFDPRTGMFHDIENLNVVKDVEIFSIRAANGAMCLASGSHRILRHRDHHGGQELTDFAKGDPVFTWRNKNATSSSVIFASSIGERGDVMEIKMAGGHVYACGASGESAIVSHNKNPYDTEEPPIN
ncbi:MAG TPA: hypothetical protein VMM38_01245 [Aridibacter sp.]|nr:hypothetical protein [Aridibacter sp.]